VSVEIVLIPLALAAVSAWQASRKERLPDGRAVCHVSSRMRNEEMLVAALADTGAVVSREGTDLVAHWEDVAAAFSRDDQGIWCARLTGAVDEGRAVNIVSTVDAAYGRRVQQAVVATLRERAQSAGMSVESERVEDDQSVTLSLLVGRDS
jgi:hypothetical protein